MNEKFPQRSEQHEIDSQGSALLSYVIPNDFIYREIGERDYGIDGLIEFTPGGQVMGILVSMQLKSTKKINWTQTGTTRISIQKSTCNYWMHNKMPFLLFLADVTNKKVYYTDIKSQIRQRYAEYEDGDNFSFVLHDGKYLEDTPDISVNQKQFLKNLIPFLHEVFTIINYDSFIESLKDFVLNWAKYFEHIKHQGADPFLIQEPEFYFTTQHINTLMLHIANTLKLSHNKVDFHKTRSDLLVTYEAWNAIPEYEVLEYEITIIHSQIQQNMPSIILGVKKYVLEHEKNYWLSCFPNVCNEAAKMDW